METLFVEDEAQRPSAEVLDCLGFIGHDACPATLPETELWDRVRGAFSCVCLPLHRLRVTAEVWRDRLTDGSCPAGSTQGLAALLPVAEWLCHADLAQWLVPTPDSRAVPLNTFVNGQAALELLSVIEVVLPPVGQWTSDHVLVCIGTPPHEWADLYPPARILEYPHAESTSHLAAGQSLDFLEDLPVECGACISLIGLPCHLQRSWLTAARAFDCRLLAYRFACDLVRLTLRLWQRGIFAALELGASDRQLYPCLSSLPGIHACDSQDKLWLWNGPGSTPTQLFHPS